MTHHLATNDIGNTIGGGYYGGEAQHDHPYFRWEMARGKMRSTIVLFVVGAVAVVVILILAVGWVLLLLRSIHVPAYTETETLPQSKR